MTYGWSKSKNWYLERNKSKSLYSLEYGRHIGYDERFELISASSIEGETEAK